MVGQDVSSHPGRFAARGDACRSRSRRSRARSTSSGSRFAATSPRPGASDDDRADARRLVEELRLRLARVVRAASRQVVLLRRGASRVHRVPGSRRVRRRLGRSDRRPASVRRARRRVPAALPRARMARRRARSRTCRARPLARARPAHRLRRRRGDRAPGRVLARGSRDPQGAPVGDAPASEAGFTCEVMRAGDLDPDRWEQVEQISDGLARRRAGARVLDGDRRHARTGARGGSPRARARLLGPCRGLRPSRARACVRRACRSRRCGACTTRRTG